MIVAMCDPMNDAETNISAPYTANSSCKSFLKYDWCRINDLSLKVWIL